MKNEMKPNLLVRKKEFGDFQTPLNLAELMVATIGSIGIKPDIIIEPTCGIGNILIAAHEHFHPQKTLGIEINSAYCNQLAAKTVYDKNISILNANIFTEIKNIKGKINDNDTCLFVGNPPWVTNAELGSLGSINIPKKENVKKLRGIEAITGKSNFDITEYIIIKLLEEFNSQKSVFAFLCKTTVARNILKYCWANNIPYKEASVFPVDAKRYFSASVDACFLVINSMEKKISNGCKVFDSIESKKYENTIGIYKNTMIINMDDFMAHNYFGKSEYIWRNGIKHDCTKVMEFDIDDNIITNGYGEIVSIEDDLLYPLLKSSDVANGKIEVRKKILVTQRQIGEDTGYIKLKYPKTWQYLNDHAGDLKKRKSGIYKGKSDFSIFSIGAYSFYPFKIAISGLYKKINFNLLKPIDGKPVMVDDTCNFISFMQESDACNLLSCLTDIKTKIFLESMIFWDSKRPITTEILNSLDIRKVADGNIHD
ncbi:MAG: hypothetical protein FWD94_05765 [Treponema sp.]|nr:hypothetical protein [Treponema sp.]